MKMKKRFTSLAAATTIGVLGIGLMSPTPAIADTDVSTTLAGILDVSGSPDFALQSFELGGKRYFPTLAHSDGPVTEVEDLGEPVVITDMPRMAWLLYRYADQIESEGQLTSTNRQQPLPASDNALLSASLSALLNATTCDSIVGGIAIGSPCFHTPGPGNARLPHPDQSASRGHNNGRELPFGVPSAGRTLNDVVYRLFDFKADYPRVLELFEESIDVPWGAHSHTRHYCNYINALQPGETAHFGIGDGVNNSDSCGHGTGGFGENIDYRQYLTAPDAHVEVTIDGPARFTSIVEPDFSGMDPIDPASGIVFEQPELGELSPNGKQWTVHTNGWTNARGDGSTTGIGIDWEYLPGETGDITLTMVSDVPPETLLYYPDAEVVTLGARETITRVQTLAADPIEVEDDHWVLQNQGRGYLNMNGDRVFHIFENDPGMADTSNYEVSFRNFTGITTLDDPQGGYVPGQWHTMVGDETIVDTTQGRWSYNLGNIMFYPRHGFVGTARAEYAVQTATGGYGAASVSFEIDPPADLADDLGETSANAPVSLDVLDNDTYAGSTPSILLKQDKVLFPEVLGPRCYGICIDGIGSGFIEEWRYPFLPEWLFTGEFPPDFDPSTFDLQFYFYGDIDDYYGPEPVTTPQGVWSVSGGEVLFTPAPGFDGLTQFDYVVIDESGNRGKPATITVEMKSALSEVKITTTGFYDEDHTQPMSGNKPVLLGSTVFFVHTLENTGGLPIWDLLVLDSLGNNEVCDEPDSLLPASTVSCYSEGVVSR